MMNDPVDLNFDVDAIFANLAEDTEYKADDVLDWVFILSSGDLEALKQTGSELEGEFIVQIEEDVEEVDDEGNAVPGDPMLVVVHRAVATADEVKQLAAKMQALADEKGFKYSGVEVYDAIDEEELFGWLQADEAIWRLNSMTEIGVEKDSELPWAFLVGTTSLELMQTTAAALGAAGFEDRDDYDEPNEDGSFGTCIFVLGRNNEVELQEASSKISAIVEECGAQLVGIQFYTREDVHEIFGDGADGEESSED